VSTLTASMIKDSRRTIIPSLHPFTEVDVGNAHGKERDGNGDPKNVLHRFSTEPRLPFYSNGQTVKMG